MVPLDEGLQASQDSFVSTRLRTKAAISVFNKYGHLPAVWLRVAGSALFYQLTERLRLPSVFSGLGHGSGAHAPNEYVVIHPRPGSKIAGVAEVEKAYVDILYAMAARLWRGQVRRLFDTARSFWYRLSCFPRGR
ncbi:MAG: hypothetical protein KatS3mg081_2167 [Gemmatimonadales bacterium]|nr:MAG: hypothetical protein KatS3mg081_2167 [Gemmatimonadales bacterium]